MRRRILFVHHRSELGGSPTSLAHLIEALDPERYETHVYSPPGPAAELFEQAGAVVHTGPVAGFTHVWASSYEGRRWLLAVRELVQLPAHLRTLDRLLEREPFDIVHLNDSPLVAAAFAARRRGIPVVWHLRSALAHGGMGLRSRAIKAAIRRTGSASIAINEDIATVFDVGARVIPNAVDLEAFCPGDAAAAKAAIDVPVDLPIVSFVGFVYPLKGFREFIAAAREIRNRGIAARFQIVGGGVRSDAFFASATGRLLEWLGLAQNYEREARRLVVELGLGDVVTFVAFTAETHRIYQASDIVVAPSRGPELGRPLIEAAASGVPVVASGSPTGGGILIPGETGVLVDGPGRPALADGLESLLRDETLRRSLGRAARAHAEEHFDRRGAARAVEDVYESLLRTSGRTPILFVHHRPQLGGAPSSLAHLIRELDHRRFEPHVYSPAGPAAELFAAAGAIVHTGPAAVFAHAWDSPYRGLRWLVLARELGALPTHLRRLSALVREYRFPIVHLNDSPLLPAARVAHAQQAKVVWHLRSALYADGRDLRSRVVCRLIDRWGDAAIAIDRDVAARFPIRLPLEIIHNSVGVDETSETATAAESELEKRRLQLPLDRVVVGYSGFLRRQKGWPELLQAARLLVDERLPVHFVIMGGGIRPPGYFETPRGRILEWTNVLANDELELTRRLAELGLDEYFSLLPFTRETRPVYSALDVVTFPNQGVGLGRPVLEAAAAGKPVVASGSRDGGGVLLPERTGILLETGTPAEIAAALGRLVRDPDLRRRLGEAAAAHAAEHFDAARNARAVERLYDRLLGCPPAREDLAEAALAGASRP